MIGIPDWLVISVLVAIGVVIVAVPIRVLTEMNRGGRERTRKLRELADRMKERFGGVRFERGMLGPPRIGFTYESRPATLIPRDDKTLILRLEPTVAPRSHVVVRTRGAIPWPFFILWESLRVLPRIRVHDSLLDESLDLFASATFGGLVQDLALDGMGGGAGEKAGGLAESLVVLNRLPGVAKFDLRMSPSGGFRVTFKLRSEDLIHRPEELEAAAHHANRLYDLLVLY